jgi:hypothetical protein
MLDPVALKILAQLDDPMPGQRASALEMLTQHFAKQQPPMTFRQLAADLDGAVPKQQFDDVETKLRATEANLQQHQHANGLAAAQHARDQAEIARLRGGVAWPYRVWAYLIVRPRVLASIVGGMLALSIGLGTYAATRPVPEAEMSAAAVDQITDIAKRSNWSWSGAQFGPAVRVLDGKPWWVALIADSDSTSFASAEGEAVTLHCFHLFARPAQAAFGNYLKPLPVEQWPERARYCQNTAIRTSSR